jgi:hypothetical protein
VALYFLLESLAAPLGKKTSKALAEDLVAIMEPFAVVLTTTSRLLRHPFSFAKCSCKKMRVSSAGVFPATPDSWL